MGGEPDDGWSGDTSRTNARVPDDKTPPDGVIPIRPDPRLSKLRSLRKDAPLDKPIRSSGAAPRSRGRWIWLALVAAGAAGGAWYWTRGRATRTPAAPIRTMVVQPTLRSVSSIVAAGYIAADELATIGSTVSGRVRQVPVVNGQTVKKGQLLVQLDDSELNAELSLAGARLREKERLVKRLQQLVKADVATVAELEQARGEAAVARAEVGVILPKIKQTRILAPTDGTVIDVLTKPGEVLTVSASAAASTGVIKLSSQSRLGMEADVNESDIALVHVADRAEVNIDSIPDANFIGAVKEIAPQADKGKGTVTVRISLQPDARLRPGMSAKVRFVGSTPPKPQLLVPKEAVENDAVWAVVDGRAHRRPVSARSAGPDGYEITSGLQAGERIVVAGGQSLAEGDRVATEP